jgi:hypothetical protein
MGTHGGQEDTAVLFLLFFTVNFRSDGGRVSLAFVKNLDRGKEKWISNLNKTFRNACAAWAERAS